MKCIKFILLMQEVFLPGAERLVLWRPILFLLDVPGQSVSRLVEHGPVAAVDIVFPNLPEDDLPVVESGQVESHVHLPPGLCCPRPLGRSRQQGEASEGGGGEGGRVNVVVADAKEAGHSAIEGAAREELA